jgi:hypothetical protein
MPRRGCRRRPSREFPGPRALQNIGEDRNSCEPSSSSDTVLLRLIFHPSAFERSMEVIFKHQWWCSLVAGLMIS